MSRLPAFIVWRGKTEFDEGKKRINGLSHLKSVFHVHRERHLGCKVQIMFSVSINIYGMSLVE